MAEPDFLLKLGDTASAITGTLENSGGTAVDIQGATVRFNMAPISGGTVEISDAATNSQVGTGGTSNATTGDVAYNWGTVPSSAGRYVAEWEVTFGGGAVQTFPNDRDLIVDVVNQVN